ncbi:MAG: Hpt domain-containing protein [Cyanobacteria bacterium J06598_1]
MTVDLKGIAVLDTDALKEIGSDRAFFAEVYRSFLADAPTRIQAIKTDLKTANSKSLVETAHALKSLSSCVGAMALFEVCKQIEILGKKEQIKSASLLMTRLTAEYKKVQIAIYNHQQQL